MALICFLCGGANLPTHRPGGRLYASSDEPLAGGRPRSLSVVRLLGLRFLSTHDSTGCDPQEIPERLLDLLKRTPALPWRDHAGNLPEPPAVPGWERNRMSHAHSLVRGLVENRRRYGEWDRQTTSTKREMAAWATRHGECDLAEEVLRQILQRAPWFTPLTREEDPLLEDWERQDLLRGVWREMETLAQTLGEQGEHHRAEIMGREILQTYRDWAGKYEGRPGYCPRMVVGVQVPLARALRAQGKSLEYVGMLRELLGLLGDSDGTVRLADEVYNEVYNQSLISEPHAHGLHGHRRWFITMRLWCNAHLAAALHEQGQHGAAEAMARRTAPQVCELLKLVMWQKYFPGDFDAASLREWRETRRALQAVLGERHPEVLEVSRNFAWLLARIATRHGRRLAQLQRESGSAERVEEFVEIFREVLRSRREALGLQHVDTLVSMYDLAMALETKQGEAAAAAREVWKRALAARDVSRAKRQLERHRSRRQMEQRLNPRPQVPEWADEADALVRGMIAGRRLLLKKLYPKTWEVLDALASAATRDGQWPVRGRQEGDALVKARRAGMMLLFALGVQAMELMGPSLPQSGTGLQGHSAGERLRRRRTKEFLERPPLPLPEMLCTALLRDPNRSFYAGLHGP
jgi:hypothetical protein